MSEPSSLMLEAFERLGCGAPSLTCWCGRDHHAPASDFIEPAEEAQMRANAEKYPDAVQLHDGDGVSAILIQGQLVVYGCKCNWLGRLESIIWSERDAILKYYKLRRDAAVKEAQALDVGLAAHETAADACMAKVRQHVATPCCDINATYPGKHRGGCPAGET